MPQTPSPLRYPGGKTSIRDLVAKIIKDNKLERGHYAEPYAGGCGLALSLLYKSYVHEIHLNDLDRSVWCFWDAVLNNTNELIKRVKKTPVTIGQWRKQRAVQEDRENQSDFDVGFSTLFMNRTNRSGIILKAGVIGGVDQKGKYRLDCRFNKEGLIEKIRRIEKYKKRIHLYNLDAVDFIKETRCILPNKSLYCVDPPYFSKGSTLYTNFYEAEDHEKIARLLLRLGKPWILTYDNAPQIQNLYSKKRMYRFHINYSAAHKRIGTELLIVSDKLIMSQSLNIMDVA